MTTRIVWTASLVLVATAWASSAHAELINCAKLSANPGDYKVVLDDFAFASTLAANNANLAELKESLQFNFNGQLESLRASARKLDRSLKVPLTLVFCQGRNPSLSGEDFTKPLAELLSDERVVVEMWGHLGLTEAAGAPPSPFARIGYTIPPVQHYENDDGSLALHLIAYPKKKDGSQSLAELQNLAELSAFALVGLGTKAAQADSYDLAVWAFTQGDASIRDAQLSGSTAGLDALLDYVRREACTVRNRARADQSYTGSLKLVPAQTCGGPQ